jgi:hypothetical protein
VAKSWLQTWTWRTWLTTDDTPRAGSVGQDRFFFTLTDNQGGFLTNLVDVSVLSSNRMSLNLARPPAVVGLDFEVAFVGVPGQICTVEWKELIDDPWQKLTNCLAPSSGPAVGIFTARRSMLDISSSFFRTVYPPY